jgi:lipopolysaccharide transport system ATP-binding protein
VKFTSAAAGVRFGMMIKTTTGLELGGAATAANTKSDLIVTPGQEFVVRFRFQTLLAPGVYFLNAGVVASNPDGDIYLDCLTDAVMLRIMPDEDRLATGFIDFRVEPEFELQAEMLT